MLEFGLQNVYFESEHILMTAGYIRSSHDIIRIPAGIRLMDAALRW